MSKDINLDDLDPPTRDELNQLAPPSQEELGNNPDVSQTESAIRGGLQGATLGYSDEIAGGLGALGSPMQVLSSDDKLGKLKELYQRYRDMERAKNDAAEKANPKTYLAGNVGGGLLAGLTGLGEVEGVGGAIGLGATAGLGASKADLTEGDFGHAAVDTAIGGTVGAVAHGIGKMIGGILSPAANKEEAAKSMAYAAGAKGLDSSKIKVGQALIDSGALKSGISEQGLGAVKQAATEAEAKLQPLLQQASDKLSTMDPKEVASAVGGDAGDKVYNLLQSALDKIKDQSSDVEQEFGENIAPKVQDYILKLKEAGNNPVRLNELKRAAAQQAQDVWNDIGKYQKARVPVPKAFEEWSYMADGIRDAIKNHIEDLGNLASPGLEDGTPGLGDLIRQNNYYAGGLSGAAKALTAKLTKDDTGIKLSNPIHYSFHPLRMGVFDAVKNLGSDVVATNKARMLSGWGNTLDSMGIGEGVGATAKALTTKAASGTPAMEMAESPFNGMFEGTNGTRAASKLSNGEEASKPAQVSNDLYSLSNDQLKGVADTLSVQKGYENYGKALNRALANKDMAAKNAALFVLAQQPDARKLLQERGLLAK